VSDGQSRAKRSDGEKASGRNTRALSDPTASWCLVSNILDKQYIGPAREGHKRYEKKKSNQLEEAIKENEILFCKKIKNFFRPIYPTLVHQTPLSSLYNFPQTLS
jgi:hypothetical protein